jgi:hypothetical protein
MIWPIVMSLALAATAEMDPSRGFCAFPTGPAHDAGADMLQVSVEADRARPQSRRVWLEVGAHRIRGRSLPLAAAEGQTAPGIVILSEELSGELTMRLRADGRAVLVILPEGGTAPIRREGRCGGVSSLVAALSPR